MSALPRGICSVCGLEVALRVGGLVREHRPGVRSLRPCPGSGELPSKTKRRPDFRTARRRR